MAETPQTPDPNLIDQAELDSLEQQLREAQAARSGSAAATPKTPPAPAATAPVDPPTPPAEPSLSAAEPPTAPVEPQASAPTASSASADVAAASESVEGTAAPMAEEPAVIGASMPAGLEAASALEFSEFAEPEAADGLANIDLLDDVELDVKIELGRTQMYIEDVLRLGEGSVVELDKLAGDPVDVYVNERLVARGEVLVLNDNFCVRISDIISVNPELEESKK